MYVKNKKRTELQALSATKHVVSTKAIKLAETSVGVQPNVVIVKHARVSKSTFVSSNMLAVCAFIAVNSAIQKKTSAVVFFNNRVRTARQQLTATETAHTVVVKKQKTCLLSSSKYTDFSYNTLIADMEHLFNQPVFIRVRLLGHAATNGFEYVLRGVFYQVFRDFPRDSEISVAQLYACIFFFAKARDTAFFTDELCYILSCFYFGQMDSTYKRVKQAIAFGWFYWSNQLGIFGIYLTLSGKLSRHLLTISRVSKLRLGKTAKSTAYCGSMYGFGCYTSETGAYGLMVNLFVESVLKTYKKQATKQKLGPSSNSIHGKKKRSQIIENKILWSKKRPHKIVWETKGPRRVSRRVRCSILLNRKLSKMRGLDRVPKTPKQRSETLKQHLTKTLPRPYYKMRDKKLLV